MAKILNEWGDKEFHQFMKNKHSGVVDFRADWCHACEQTEPIISEVSQKYPDLTFSKIDVAKFPELASKMGVMSLPNILIINQGKVVDQIIGATSSQNLEKMIKKIAL